MEHKISNDLIINVLRTLKEIDVRGFDSMNRLVGLVMLFEDILNRQNESEEKGVDS